jgi:hypothetical protein
MSKEKQIEEIAKDLCQNTFCSFEEWNKCKLKVGEYCANCRCMAERFYNAGYRKQSEPISCGHEKGGEWVQLPCKVGDILYVISQMKDKRILPFINEYEVTSICIKRKSIVIYHEMDGYIKSFKQTDFGRTIFLTKEEAERAVTGINVGSK